MPPPPVTPILVSVIGAGLVGTEFITQLLSLNQTKYPIRLFSISSSTRTISAPDHSHPLTFASPSQWKSLLQDSSDKSDIRTNLTQKLQALVAEKHKLVVIDNTSNQDIAAMYPVWLRSGIHIVTPNKKAFSGSQALFMEIVKSSEESGAKFFNESTVGAGLPVISTLKDLVETGDKITKIEGVFSGTMSYIFNLFSPVSASTDAPLPSISSIVKIAKEKGFTEPHPADDLNGFDVARKLTILARLASDTWTSAPLPGFLPEGYKSVNTRSLIPPALEDIADGSTFVERLAEFDGEFDKMRQEAMAKGNILRYVGVVNLGDKDRNQPEVKASLESYPKTHPLAALSGADNIVLFHTERYGDRPLIIQGPGAGAVVTAMGVLADLLRLVD